MRWARIALCTLAVSSATVAGSWSAGAAAPHASPGPALGLISQSPVVTPTQPWFHLSVGVGADTGTLSDLHVSVTFYGRIDNDSQLQTELSTTPEQRVIQHVDLPVTAPSGRRGAASCVTVLRDADDVVPTPGPGTTGACASGAQTVTLSCTPDYGTCGDVYPVSVALLRSGSTTPLSRFTTFLTYVEPGVQSSTGGSLNVALIMPLDSPATSALGTPSASDRQRTEALAGLLSAHGDVATTLALSPSTMSDLLAHGGSAGRRAQTQLSDLTAAPDGDQLLTLPYVPINLAALANAGLGGEITEQVSRGATLLHQADLHPSGGTWVDTASTFSTADGGDLATGLQTVRAGRLVVNDGDLASAGPEDQTLAQPFTLDLGHGVHVRTAAANSQVDALFTAHPQDPALEANQLLASLSFIHFENAYYQDPRGVVVDPPSSWQATSTFLTPLLDGLADNPALSTVTLDQLFAKVPVGGISEPATRHLQPGSAATSLTAEEAQHIALDRSDLSSFSAAVSGHPASVTTLADLLLATEDQRFSAGQRAAAVTTYNRAFSAELGLITLAAERTITFTSRSAHIPVTVLSSAPFTVKVVLTLSSDKFSFPDGATRTLTLSRQSTPVRVQAISRTSGDRLPVVITLTTPDGALTIATTGVTVHSTSISIVGIALTVLAGLVLLVWWVRTWRKGRRRRPRAH